MQDVMDEHAATKGIEYEAVVEKKKDVGLGINVVEDRLRRRIVVQVRVRGLGYG